jgi:fatty acid desaturase
MSSTEVMPAGLPPTPARHALPDPGESVPKCAWPTVAIFFGALATFVVSSWAAIDGAAPGG